jgi:hypothetical protein
MNSQFLPLLSLLSSKPHHSSHWLRAGLIVRIPLHSTQPTGKDVLSRRREAHIMLDTCVTQTPLENCFLWLNIILNINSILKNHRFFDGFCIRYTVFEWRIVLWRLRSLSLSPLSPVSPSVANVCFWSLIELYRVVPFAYVMTIMQHKCLENCLH